jgi:hypothetical protein
MQAAPMRVRHFVLFQEIARHQVAGQFGLCLLGDGAGHDDLAPRRAHGLEVVTEQSAERFQTKWLGEWPKDLSRDVHAVHAGDVAKRVHQGVEVVEAREAARRHENQATRLRSAGRMPGCSFHVSAGNEPWFVAGKQPIQEGLHQTGHRAVVHRSPHHHEISRSPRFEPALHSVAVNAPARRLHPA